MSERVCYVSSADRGDRLTTVRMVGARSEDAWRAPESTDPLAVMGHVDAAAAWIAEHLGAEGRSAASLLPILCVDVESASCTWLTAPSTDAAVVSAALAHAVEGENSRLSGAWASPTLAEASVEALSSPTAVATEAKPAAITRFSRKPIGPAAIGAQRLAVLAIPDVSARLLLDALDDRSITVDRVISLWHAMAAAWDPNRPTSRGSDSPDVVATTSPVAATLLIDPSGRLLWAWSRAGQLLAAGTIRLPQERHDLGAGVVRIGRSEVGRLTTDWLSWSMQLGLVPARIVCLTPSAGSDGDDDDLTPQGIGAALGGAWPGATIDMAVNEDPIGATLSRLVDQKASASDDTRSTLTLLTHRPGRAHRQLYWWAAACVLAVSVALAGIGWKAMNTARASRQAGADLRASMLAKIEETAAPVGDYQQQTALARPRIYMEEQLTAKRQASNPNLEPAKPILSELETLSYVLGTREVEIDEISLMSGYALVYVRVPNTATAEMVKASLDTVADSRVEWRGEFPETRGNQTQTTYVLRGQWKPPAGSPRGSTSAAAGGAR